MEKRLSKEEAHIMLILLATVVLKGSWSSSEDNTDADSFGNAPGSSWLTAGNDFLPRIASVVIQKISLITIGRPILFVERTPVPGTRARPVTVEWKGRVAVVF